MIFVDGIAITRRFEYDVKQIAGVRRINYREKGDIGKDGVAVDEQEVLGETFNPAWIQGSHDSKIQLKSDGRVLTLKGNPGRFGRPDNLYNQDLDETITSCNLIVSQQGFPFDTFSPGVRLDYENNGMQSGLKMGRADEASEQKWSGSRVWSIHITQNYATGSPDNVKPFIDWCNAQSMARIKKARLGATTVVWGSIRYCQTEVYGKADEMLAHCKTQDERDQMKQSQSYQYAMQNGIVRVEVKCAKDFLVQQGLTYLGNWDMGQVIRIFNERTELISRARVDLEDTEWLQTIPRASRIYAEAWMKGIDVASTMSRATFFRHAKVLREAGIDISEKRNVTSMPVQVKTIKLEPVAPPEWYRMTA